MGALYASYDDATFDLHQRDLFMGWLDAPVAAKRHHLRIWGMMMNEHGLESQYSSSILRAA
jgi:hypothetical protein